MTRTTVVTGASSGIGKEFARRFAQRGDDVVLVARRLERLESLSVELRERYAVTVTPVPLDLTAPRPGAELHARLAEHGIVASALVNCAGFGRTELFSDADDSDIADQLAVGVTALVDLTKAFYADLQDAEAGLLINVASMTGYAPIPGMAVYAAAKAFVISFTEALWVEARGSRLRVLCLSPGATSSEFYTTSGTSTEGIRFQTPRQVVDTAFHALDTSRRPTIVSGRANALLAGLMRTLPKRLVLTLAARQAPKPAAVAAARTRH
ncbi:SDR family NAD(P)-dependent oxidoreductase [Streptomyces sp. NPDC126933]|uniref:SDR family NAD(P)-dependent oxidoreductase n=1 Tax=unclassified Streptomyces TaxID=2593676 RepID=UPI00364B9777